MSSIPTSPEDFGDGSASTPWIKIRLMTTYRLLELDIPFRDDMEKRVDLMIMMSEPPMGTQWSGATV
jgi:hypothetical protein